MGKRKAKPVTAEEFTAWREDPVTAWVMGELGKAAEAQKTAWIDATWSGGIADQEALTTLRTRADAYSALSQVTYDQLAEIE